MPDLTLCVDRGHGTSYVLTKDERYLILMYEYYKKSFIYNNIEIVDFENNSARVSKIKAPAPLNGQRNELFIVDQWNESDVVVNGFVRETGTEMICEMIDIMIKYYNKTDVHLLHGTSGDHWKISLADLLN